MITRDNSLNRQNGHDMSRRSICIVNFPTASTYLPHRWYRYGIILIVMLYPSQPLSFCFILPPLQLHIYLCAQFAPPVRVRVCRLVNVLHTQTNAPSLDALYAHSRAQTRALHAIHFLSTASTSMSLAVLLPSSWRATTSRFATTKQQFANNVRDDTM